MRIRYAPALGKLWRSYCKLTSGVCCGAKVAGVVSFFRTIRLQGCGRIGKLHAQIKHIMDKVKRFIKSYETWVAANPETVCDVETTTKWISYFIAGRISDSNVVSELVYSLSNMLVLYNDRIIDRAQQRNAKCLSIAASTSSSALLCDERQSKQQQQQRHCYRIKVMVTTLEYCEVLIEISAKRLFGSKGKWLFVALVQLLKATGRFFILKHSTEQIITTPAMPNLNRRALIKQQKAVANGMIVEEAAQPAKGQVGPSEHSNTFQLRRSRRVMRKVEGAPPLQYRDFKMPGELVEQQSSLPLALLRAEYLYIAKPLLHLAAMGLFGEKRWTQYVVSATLDLVSIRLYHQHRQHMSKAQKLELSRRCINLLIYLARSPFYERYTRSRLDCVLGFVADNVPVVKLVAAPLREYIPYWQSTYFYLWST